jgi:hypothetical protein
MSFEDFDRSSSQASDAEAVNRRWLLSKRADDGRPLLVREDKATHPSRFTARPRRVGAPEPTDAGTGTPALT